MTFNVTPALPGSLHIDFETGSITGRPTGVPNRARRPRWTVARHVHSRYRLVRTHKTYRITTTSADEIDVSVSFVSFGAP